MGKEGEKDHKGSEWMLSRYCQGRLYQNDCRWPEAETDGVPFHGISWRKDSRETSLMKTPLDGNEL